MRRALLALALVFAAADASAQEIAIGYKKVTESVILGEIVADLARAAGATPTHRRELGGTREQRRPSIGVGFFK